MSIGKELVHDKSLHFLERVYIAIFGIPINGLRIRARRVLPLITSKYKRILDAGCGQGIFTFEMARRLPESTVIGFDIDRQLLTRNKELAQKVGLSNCHFEYQDLTAMTVESQYDAIVNVDNLEHLEDDIGTLKNFYNALKPNGELILHVPAYERIWVFFQWKVNFDVDGHMRPGYRKEEIEKKVKKVGFRIINTWYTYGWIETVTNNISYLITKARMQNKYLYALVFPLLNFFSYFGRNSKPAKGAGVLIRAVKS